MVRLPYRRRAGRLNRRNGRYYFRRNRRIPRTIGRGAVGDTRVQYFKQSMLFADYVSDTTNSVGIVYKFKMGMMPQFASIQQLFDQVCVTYLKWKFVPASIINSNPSPGVYTIYGLYTVVDYNDDANLSSISDALSYSTCRQALPGRYIARGYKPSISMASIGGAGAISASVVKFNQWINTSSDPYYYGLKCILPACPGAPALVRYDVSLTVWYKCRSLK